MPSWRFNIRTLVSPLFGPAPETPIGHRTRCRYVTVSLSVICGIPLSGSLRSVCEFAIVVGFVVLWREWDPAYERPWVYYHQTPPAHGRHRTGDLAFPPFVKGWFVLLSYQHPCSYKHRSKYVSHVPDENRLPGFYWTRTVQHCRSANVGGQIVQDDVVCSCVRMVYEMFNHLINPNADSVRVAYRHVTRKLNIAAGLYHGCQLHTCGLETPSSSGITTIVLDPCRFCPSAAVDHK